MRSSLDLNRLINDLLALGLHACDAENGTMIQVDDDSNELVFVEVIGETSEHLLNHRIDIDMGIVGHGVKTRKAMLVTDVHKSSRWSSQVGQIIGFNTNALMRAPLFNNANTYRTIEVVNYMSSNEFDENNPAILRVSARFVSQALPEAEDITLLEGEKF